MIETKTEITHIYLITCSMIGNSVIKFDINYESSNTPNISSLLITCCKRDGFYSCCFELSSIKKYAIGISVDADLSIIPETGRNGIPKEVKKLIHNKLRMYKIRKIIGNIKK